MNVLTDIVCDTSLIPQNFKESYPQNKMISTQDMSSKQGSLHLLNTVSQLSTLDRPLSSMTHSSPSNIHLFNSSGPIQIPSNVDTGFEDRSDVSVFSDQFQEIVPSWLTHDFMKVSESLPSPTILSNVSDIYPSSRETEHLEMLDLGFPAELSSQDVVPNNLNGSINNQKLLVELPMQRFSNNDPLLMSSFNGMNELNSMQYSKFKQNVHINSPSSIMSSVLPCENDLLHIPLHANLAEQCLTTTSSPSIMSSSQSQSHPVDVVCDKLPQINLNHLDSFLGSESTLSEIQILRQDFPGVCMPVEVNSNQSNQSCLNNCNPNQHSISCRTSVFLNPHVTPLAHTQDASVQVTENAIGESLIDNGNCFSCSKVSPEMAIEVTQCFKCKFCDFINIHKCAVESHINTSHSKSLSSLLIMRNEITQSGQRSYVTSSVAVREPQTSDVHLSKSNAGVVSNNNLPSYNSHINSINNTVLPPTGEFIQTKQVQCIKCNKVFSEVTAYETHLISDHNINPELLRLSSNKNNAVSYPLVPVLVNSNESSISLTSANNNPYASHQSINNNIKTVKSKTKEVLKKPEDMHKKILPKKTSNNDVSTANSEKAISSHKKAWRKKIRRELGSYICEFKGCNVRFRALDNLEYHRKCHVSGGNSFACPECGAGFENWGTVAGHLWRTHKNDMELHACDQCQFRTYSLSRLENLHKRIHRDEYLFLCDTCGKSFKTGKQLRSHRVIHNKTNNKKPKEPTDFKCRVCSIRFSSKVLLRRHEETIHDIKHKRFMCSHCDYTCSKPSTLRLHTRQHTGEKPFECTQCDYRTSDHNSLRRHKMKHSGEKPYKCPYCPYTSIQASCFKSHMKKHPDQNEVMFSCQLCSFQTVKRETYLQHMEEHESIGMLQNANCINEMNATEDMFPLAEAMDISLSHGDDYLIPHFNKNKNTIQSFFNNLDSNILSVCQESAR